MPRISLVVPAYNVEDFIGRCLDSIRAQSFEDYEVYVVDDASTDGTAAAIERNIYGDNRFVCIRLTENRGLHVVRKVGLEACKGDYTLFLDGDDELAPGMLAELDTQARATGADVLHYGITVVGERGVTDSDAQSFADFINNPTADLFGPAIVRSIFEEGYYETDWRATQRLVKTPLMKRAFDAMTDERLERAEDGYEVFVLSALAEHQAPAEKCRGYVYHYGIGATGASAVSAERFGRFCEQFKACIDATRDFVAQRGDDEALLAGYHGMRRKMLELLANDWLVRVGDEEKGEAASHLVETFGAAAGGCELWRIVRDRAYDFVAKGFPPAADDPLTLYADIASAFPASEGGRGDVARYERTRRAAETHLRQVDDMRVREEYASEPVRILVTTHKRVDHPMGTCHQLVQVGPSLKDPGSRFHGVLHDDDGENITDLNPMYCEMTVQYWAWKNVRADYVGFCHYRRYFNFSGNTYPENPYGEVMDDYIDAHAVDRYGLDDETVRSCVEGYDVITTGFHDLRAIPGKFSTPYEHYSKAPLLHIADIDRMVEIIAEQRPDYVRDAKEFLNGHESCFCNMYIMRNEIFQAYCEWIFPILEAFTERTDMSHYSKEALRTPGHLAERLFNIYYRHAMRTGAGWKTKQLQCVHFERPDRAYDLEPAIMAHPEAMGREVVPVVFASDDGYVPMLTTTIFSMLCNASRDRFYDIVVLERNIDYRNKRDIESLVAEFGCACVRFVNVERMIDGYDLSTNNEHISLETYYRFLVQEILSSYDKVLYLDCDLIVRGDVAELYDTPLGDNLLAAAHDIDYLGNLNMNDGKRMRYTTDVLGLVDPYAYFQAGVLVLNTREMRLLHSVPEWMRIVSDANYIYDDQDILNAECQGRVTFLPFDWNVMHDCGGRVDAVFKFAPGDVFDAYNASRRDPKIVHYAGYEKPWVNPACDFATQYWGYARRMPFYEQLVAKLAANVAGADYTHRGPVEHEKAVSPESPIRRIIDPIAPYGSARREVLKSIGRAVQGKK